VVDDSRLQALGEERAGDFVELRLPPNPVYLAVLRTATAGLAASLDFTLDEIEDLRIAVDEACAILMPDVVAGELLDCLFALEGDVLDVTVSARIDGDHRPEQGSFGWTVLEALAGSVESGAKDGRAYLRLRKRRAAGAAR
jgi:serine/threonine-protein kinase RsbW